MPNLAVQGMASAHRERLGKKLVKICQGVKERGGRCEDGGVRIEGLLDAGADPNGRSAGGNTPLHLVSSVGLRKVLPLQERNAFDCIFVESKQPCDKND